MIDITIQLLQFLGILVPVLFVAVRFLHSQIDDEEYPGRSLRIEGRSRDGPETPVYTVPYPTLLYWGMMLFLSISLLVLMSNVALYTVLKTSVDLLVTIAVVFSILGLYCMMALLLLAPPWMKSIFF